FNVRACTTNKLLKRIASLTLHTRSSRHSGHVRLPLNEYRAALLKLIIEDGSDCIEMLGLQSLISDLSARLRHKEPDAHEKLLDGIREKTRRRRSIDVDAREFNLAAERFYREELKRRHLQEGLASVRHLIKKLDPANKSILGEILPELSPSHFLNEIEHALSDNSLTEVQLSTLIGIVLLVIKAELGHSDETRSNDRYSRIPDASIYRSAHSASSR